MRSWQGIYLTYRSGRHIHVIYHVYTMYIPYIYYVYIIHIQTLHLSLVYTMYIPCIYKTYTCIYNWYSMYLLFSGLSGTHQPPAQPTHGLEDNVPDVHDEFWYFRYTSSVGNIHDPYVQAGGCWVPGSRTGWVKVQGPGKLLSSYNKNILVICITYTMHIPCIPRNLNCIYRKF